jgi:hypothetical protein
MQGSEVLTTRPFDKKKNNFLFIKVILFFFHIDNAFAKIIDSIKSKRLYAKVYRCLPYYFKKQKLCQALIFHGPVAKKQHMLLVTKREREGLYM